MNYRFMPPPPGEAVRLVTSRSAESQPSRFRRRWSVELSFEPEGLASEPVLFPDQPQRAPEVFLEARRMRSPWQGVEARDTSPPRRGHSGPRRKDLRRPR